MTKMSKWDHYFMDIADRAALLSKDESTKLGSVIVGPRRQIVSTGFNSFPRGINDHVSERQKRPGKYFYVEHAERNAIYNAERTLAGCTLYCAWPPCADCARAIIQVGIIEVVAKSIDAPVGRWADNMRAAREMLHEAGVILRQMED